MKEKVYLKELSNKVVLKPLNSVNREFLLKVFKESREYLAFNENMIIDQFKFEQQGILREYPSAKLNVIFLDNEPVGTVYINYGEVNRILEIAILKKYRNIGIGSQIISKIIDISLKEDKDLYFSVFWFNVKAYRLYKRLGFEVIKNIGVSYEMQYVG